MSKKSYEFVVNSFLSEANPQLELLSLSPNPELLAATGTAALK
jgi:hypothetical protein